MPAPDQAAPTEPNLREGLGLALGFIGVVIFGGTLPATRIALGTFTPAFITFGRATVAGLAAALILAVLRRRIPRGDLIALAVAGLLLVFGFPIFSSFALRTVPASHGAVVLGVMPLLTSLFAALFGGERPSLLFWICGVAGSLLVVVFALQEGGMTLSAGDVALFAAAISACLGYVIFGRLSRRMPGWEVISWALVITWPASMAGAALSWHDGFLQASAAEQAAFLYLSLFSMFLGFFAWNVGLALGGIARVGQVQLLQTFVTLAIAAVLLGEEITWRMIGFAVAVLAVVLIGRRAGVSRD